MIYLLASQPHLIAFPKHLRGNIPPAVRILLGFGGRQPVEHRFDRRAGIPEPDGLQLAAEHELHPLSELAFFIKIGAKTTKWYMDLLFCIIYPFLKYIRHPITKRNDICPEYG